MSRRIGTSYCWGVLSGPRLRQVALVARDCGQVADELRRAFGWPPPFHDPGVGRFGLTNAVFAAGDTFVEVVAPAQPDTTAGRYLERRGGDAGYMAIFQARSLARLGDRRTVTAALDRGHKLLHGVPLAANMVNHFVVDPAKFDFYAMDCLRVVGDDDRAAEHAREVLRAGRGPDGQDISPMRMSEARIALGCVAARTGDLDEAAAWGSEAFRADRKCLPSLALVAGELDDEMRARYPEARPAVEFREQLAEIRQMLPAN